MRGGLGLVACGIRGCYRLCPPVNARALTNRRESPADTGERRQGKTGNRAAKPRTPPRGGNRPRGCDTLRGVCRVLARAGAERVAHIAQSVERDLGKIEVTGSIPVVGSCESMAAAAVRG